MHRHCRRGRRRRSGGVRMGSAARLATAAGPPESPAPLAGGEGSRSGGVLAGTAASFTACASPSAAPAPSVELRGDAAAARRRAGPQGWRGASRAQAAICAAEVALKDGEEWDRGAHVRLQAAGRTRRAAVGGGEAVRPKWPLPCRMVGAVVDEDTCNVHHAGELAFMCSVC